MNLPSTSTPLLDFADQSKVSQSLILKFIEEGGADYMMNAWLAYSVKELRNRKLLDKTTPVEALDLGRRIFEDIFTDFLQQFNDKNPEDK